ncbi:MAG: endonuclease/exonuclease/phosphatase family protein [Phycisphaerae bacterium]|nr:endonuclease/exonuclease/phosphatase family protein [Phycisphaerae bacterium]
MFQQRSLPVIFTVGLVLAMCIPESCGKPPSAASSSSVRVRFATFNVWELDSAKLARVRDDGKGAHLQLCKAAEIAQRVQPDVLLINEIDFDPQHRKNAGLFLERYLKVSQNRQPPLDYPYIFFETVNTGLPTGLDLNNDGKTIGPEDAFGYGRYEGQYGMALYSRFPIDREHVRTFQKLKWKDMPSNLMPDGTGGKPKWYAPLEAAVFRLSSKSHWDVPLQLDVPGHGDKPVVIHILACHPTPPAFDGPEDRNGRRNFDEIRLMADYVAGGERAGYLVDDQGVRGGLPSDAQFVIMGDLNADRNKDEEPYGQAAIDQLLRSPRITDPKPCRSGGDGLANWAKLKTAGFGRIDYVLPSVGLKVASAGIFWPAPSDPLHRLIDEPHPSSDHRLVYVDIVISAATKTQSVARQ